MNRATRDRFTTPTTPHITQGNACLETPPAVFHALEDSFGPFEIDLCADAQNHLLPLWFGPDSPVQEFDALKANWHAYAKNGFGNPPYGPFVGLFLAWAKVEAKLGFASTLLLPVRITKAFHAHVLQGASEVWFCDKRIAFWQDGKPKLDPATKKPTGALFDSMIVRFAPGMRFSPPRVGSWKVPPHDKKSI